MPKGQVGARSMHSKPASQLLALALFFLAAACMLETPVSSKSAPSPDPAALGERIYKTGIGVSGRPIAAIGLSGEEVLAPQFRCVSCHRASGYGSKEGGVYVAPVVAPVLYQPLHPDRARAFSGMYYQDQSGAVKGRLNQARTRPAYDLESLGRLLRTGIDPAGNPVPHAMPRYKLSDRDVAALDAWLRTLSATPDPGVDDTTIRFALIVSDDIPDGTRKALVDTAGAWVARVNKDTNGDRGRPNFSPYYRSEFEKFWREWAVDVWELHGPRESWPAQLEHYYNTQPVFAAISGAVSGTWQPVGTFCDKERLPCLFPITDLPAPEGQQPGYTLYSNGGLPLEAQVMAAYLRRELPRAPIVQLAFDEVAGSVPAKALADAVAGQGGAKRVITISVSQGGWNEALGRALAQAGPDTVLVMWPGSDADGAVAALASVAGVPKRVMLGSQAESAAVARLGAGPLAERIRIIRRREMPGVINPHSYRVRGWLNARRVAINPPEEQFQVYYALSVLDKAVMQIQGDFSRDYLIEEIEMIAESNLNPGVFPFLSLGPGQRVASRGAYVVKLSPSAMGGIEAEGDLIIP